MIFYQPSKEVIVRLEPNPLGSSLYDTTLGLFGLDGYVLLFRVVTISPVRVLNRVSVWAVKVEEEQSIVTFLVPTLFPPGFCHVSNFKS